MLTIFFFCYSLVPFITRIFEGRLVIKRHISFDHGPPVGSHSAGLAGVAGYLFAFLHFSLLLFFVFFFFYLTFSVGRLLFVRAVVLSFLSFFRQKKTKRDGALEVGGGERWNWGLLERLKENWTGLAPVYTQIFRPRTVFARFVLRCCIDDARWIFFSTFLYV